MENRSGKYLKYAIGEILLVVVGILIAFQVNNWNEYRKAKWEEIVALNDLLVEFQRNRDSFLIYSERQREIESAWYNYLMVINNLKLPDSIRTQDRPIVGIKGFKISNNKLNSLLTTGYIDRIQNDSLKQLLLNWEDILLTYQAIEENQLKHANESLIPLEQKIRPSKIFIRNSGIESSFYTPQEMKRFSTDALKNLQYQNGLIQNYHWLRLKVNHHEILINHLDLIIEQLKNSIEENG